MSLLAKTEDERALIDASFGENLDEVRRLLLKGVNPNVRYNYVRRLLGEEGKRVKEERRGSISRIREEEEMERRNSFDNEEVDIE